MYRIQGVKVKGIGSFALDKWFATHATGTGIDVGVRKIVRTSRPVGFVQLKIESSEKIAEPYVELCIRQVHPHTAPRAFSETHHVPG